MFAAEFILFAILFAIPIIWTVLKVLVTHLIDSERDFCADGAPGWNRTSDPQLRRPTRSQ
jgi:hypothetical protein